MAGELGWLDPDRCCRGLGSPPTGSHFGISEPEEGCYDMYATSRSFLWLGVLASGSLLGLGASSAHAQIPGTVAPAPYYAAPAPRYTNPAPAYSVPTAAYATPAPRYAAPAYAAPAYALPATRYVAPAPAYAIPSPANTAPADPSAGSDYDAYSQSLFGG